jgi:hypothetical protein
MQFVRPVGSDVAIGAASAPGTVVTLLPNRWYTADVALTAVQSVLGTKTATLTWTPAANNTGAFPASSQILAQCVVTGLATGVGDNDTATEILIYTGSTGGTLVFDTGGASAATCTVNGSHT